MNPKPATLLILQGGRQIGPFPSESVVEMLRVGALSPGDFGWTEGMTDWLLLSELFPDSQAPSAPVAPAKRSKVSVPQLADGSDRTFIGYVQNAFVFPFKGDGIIILALGAVFFTVMNFLSQFSLAGLLLGVFASGYLFSMVISVVQTTANGDDRLPSWPDFGNWKDDIFDPWAKLMALSLFCFGPALAVGFFGGLNGAAAAAPAAAFLLLLGAIYFPMAIMAVALSDSIAGLNPMLVVPAIFSLLGRYMLVLLLGAFAGAVPLVAGLAIEMVPVWAVKWLMGPFVGSLMELWAWFFMARILGGLYRTSGDAIDW